MLSRPASDPQVVLPRSCAWIEQGMQVGLHIGAQAYVALRRASGWETIADFGLGQSRPGVPMTADTSMLWFSSGKPVGAVAILQLVELGKLSLDDPVAVHIPEFAAHGKQAITLRHILTHTGGFRWVDIDWRESWDDTIDRICNVKIERNWVVGQTAGYHPFSSWYILGEVVRRVDGRPYGDYVRQEIFLPLGMLDSWVGMPLEQFEAYGNRLGVMQHLEKSEPAADRYDRPAAASVCVPGGNARGPMHDLGRFYQMLLEGGQLEGTRVLTDKSVRLMTTPQRVGQFDETFRHVMDWGLGMIMDNNRYDAETIPYGYGKYSSPRTFGHGGKEASVGFADPDRQLVVTVVFNGMPGEAKHDVRMRSLLTALYEDLGFA